MTIDLFSMEREAAKYASHGIKLRVAVLVKNFFLNDDQIERALKANFNRSDRVITGIKRVVRAGTIFISENSANGQTRIGPQAGFHDLRDALVGKKLGTEAAKERGAERQPGLLARIGVSGVRPEDVIFLEKETC